MRAALLGVMLWAVACAPPQGDDQPVVLETEDVGPGLDEVDLTSDRKGAPRSATSGKLPGGFPDGLPIYKPSTISDLGEGETVDFVQFMSQDDTAAVRSWYPAALTRAGWSVESGPGDSLIVSRGQLRARISIESSGPVTLIRVEY